ncbi:WD repeat domain-containing protein 83-like [Portunus trituberculatus]|uniref:WD repeat domain-containing protein 83 n=1 Tax=Portunus trituberculatus TaxID=210409 RepID=A0A5B7DHB8_PORTR|nr:WD repeat domain-containing protein 83-like [Portunus trituberculatus]XP_045115926.1 WD repeat domain-containing protein 83-like [Portunus trituberculatus]MPC20594.1 WD repeat domain-containing protein 83 [Portunus trituberculatus]
MSSGEGPPTHLVRVLECKQGAVRAVRFNVDGGYCLTCGSDKSVKLWNPHKGTLLHTYAGHGYEVLDARGSCDNSLIGSCGLDKSVMMWNVSTGESLRKFRGHAARVNCVCFNEESTVILSGSMDGKVKVWDLRSRRNDPIQDLDEAKDSVMTVSISSHLILTASLDGYTRVYDLRNGQLTSNCIGESVTCASLSGDSQCILTSSLGSSLRLMDRETGELLAQYSGHNSKDYKVESCFTPSDTHVMSGSEDGCVYCWDLVQSTLTNKLEHRGSTVVHSLNPHPSQPFLLTASLGQVWLWSAHPQT